MSDINRVSVKLTGDAAGLKAAAAEAKVAIANLKNNMNSSQTDIVSYFHAFKGGFETANGSLRGMAIALKNLGPMMPYVAAGLLFEAFRKLSIGKTIIEGITDALGFTSHAFDEETKKIKEQNEAIIKTKEYEFDLAKARGITHTEELQYLKDINQIKIDDANREINRIKEEDLKKKASFGTVLSVAIMGVNKNLGANLAADVIAGASKKKLSQESIDLIQKQNDIILALNRSTIIATTKDEKKASDEVVKNTIDAWKEAAKIRDDFIKSYNKQQEKDSEDLHKKLLGQIDSTDEAEKNRQIAINELYRKESIAVRGLAGAFDALFSGGKNGWKDMQRQMVSYFERMIAEVAAAIVVWTVLDILSGGTAAGGGTGMSLGKFIGKTLGFAGGTSYAPGGMAVVGEYGPELVNLPRGSRVYNNSQTNNMLSGGTVLIKFVDGSLQGYLDFQNRKTNSYR